MHKTTEPRTCYICGSPVTIEHNSIWVKIKCNNCALDFGRYWFTDENKLISCWNNWTNRKDARP